MTNTPKIWSQSKFTVYFNIALICVVNLVGLVITIVYWKELDLLFRSVLIGSMLLAIPFLMMYVLGMNLAGNQITFVLPHKRTSMNLSEIRSARVMKKKTHDYLEIRTNTAIGIRKRFLFLVHKNEETIAAVLNTFVKNQVNVYSNASLETSVKYNHKTGMFESIPKEN